jgi:hypothetical protein
MDSLMTWLVKLIFFLMLLPFLVCLLIEVISKIFQSILLFLSALVPWIVGIAVIIGIVAGISAALGLRSRLPARVNTYPEGPGLWGTVKRPRGARRADD